MEQSVTIKSVKDATRLVLSNAAGEFFTASLESVHFTGTVVVSTYVSGSPSLLFDEIAREWKGWEGKKIWVALENELHITASSDPTGHIELAVIMRNYSDPANWRLEAILHVEAGQLDELAHRINALFGMP